MSLIIRFICVFLIIFSCNEKKKNTLSKSNIEFVDSLNTPQKEIKRLIPITKTNTILYEDFKVNFKSEEDLSKLTKYKKPKQGFYSSDYEIQYVGYKDNWYKLPMNALGSLGYQFNYFPMYSEEDKKALDSINPHNIQLKLEVDTTQYISSWMNKKLSYPLYLKNTSNQTAIKFISIGFPAIMEAKDRMGNWKPIQSYLYNFCGNGYIGYRLEPKGYFVSSVPIYNGKYKTKCRIKSVHDRKTYYSNEFYNTIYESLLKLDSIENEDIFHPNYDNFLNSKL